MENQGIKKLFNIVTPLHKKSKRNYIEHMINEKVACSKIAREYSKDYWDGDRKCGYGGYRYDGRWQVVAQKLIEAHSLPDNAKILDVGCGKGFFTLRIKKSFTSSRD